MKGDPQIIKLLNGILKNELTAINQYFLHARMLQDWGLAKMGAHEYKESIEEMGHADKLIKRVLFLEGLPNLQDLGKLMIGENVLEILENDLKLEVGARADLVEGVTACEAAKDYVSRQILDEILADTEEHIDYLETEIGLVEKVGLPNYIQSQMDPGGGS
ncbi:MAG: bacterioferritin [Rhodospirillum sp.]|nr:bacterioferritin [Rhodospirillum sp.]MCF8491614.1 bacterioferritin [Rhodospirillum sp.]MCF8499523.1 bacterioferritin [Rhodospirillum sp.]